MKVTQLAKNRVMLEHNGKKVRIEINGGDWVGRDEWNIYLPSNAHVYRKNHFVLGRRKIVVAI